MRGMKEKKKMTVDDNILLEIAKQFNKNALSVNLLAKCRNAIYKVDCTDYSFMLRLSSERHRNAEQIKSELDFQKYLFDNGGAVAKVLQTDLGETCLPLENE